jgi:hemerythrin superfamily protein
MPKAIEMLREDHEKVKGLFKQFEQTESNGKKEIVATTLKELEIHTALEEQIFYPAAREALEEESEETDIMDEAWEEHHVVKLVAAELKKMRPNDERYDAKFTVMAENVKHHIEEEESELFPKLEGHIDEEALGEQMMARKEKLQQRPGSASRPRTAKAKTRSTTGTSKRKTGRGKKSRSRAAGGRRY